MKLVSVLFVCLMAAGAALVAGDPAAGKAKYQVCVACHGANGEGNQALGAPALAGQEDWYLERQLKNYKDGVRGSDPKDTYGMQMKPMAATLVNDTDIANVVAFIQTFPDKKPASTISGGNAATGKALYATCAACHGNNGEGNKALGAPRLNNQPDWYMVRQLHNFKDGIRGKHPKDTYGMQMAPMAAMLTNDQAIVDVVAYIKSLGK